MKKYKYCELNQESVTSLFYQFDDIRFNLTKTLLIKKVYFSNTLQTHEE